MADEQSTTDETVHLSYTQTAADMKEGHYASARTGQALGWKIVIYIEAVIIMLFAALFAYNRWYIVTALLALASAYLFLRTQLYAWWLQRWFRKKFGERLAVTIAITSHHLASKDELGNEFTIAWPMIEKVVRFDKGFLLYTNPRNYTLFPLRGFATPADLDRFIEYARAGAKKYVDVS